MNWLLSRLVEPSTYAGLGAIGTGVYQIATTGNVGGAVSSIIGGLLAFVVPEGNSATIAKTPPS